MGGMVESYIKDRIIFPSQISQRNFIFKVQECKKISLNELAGEWKINRRTLFAWMKGENHMPYDLVLSNSERFGIKIPKTAKRLVWKDHLKKVGIKGGQANLVKNGGIRVNAEYRNRKWREWWEEKGRYKPHKILESEKINFPDQSVELAEFIGIMLGDGTITQYRVAVCLNKNESLYADFVSSLIKKLFHIESKKVSSKIANSLEVVVYRKQLVDFLIKSGLFVGNKIKHGADIPNWIMKNIEFQKVCIRGLIDTDGCIFDHTYKSNNKVYVYQKIDFTSASRPLLDSAFKILINLGFSVRICKSGKALRIEDQKGVARYIKEVGSNNPRYKNK